MSALLPDAAVEVVLSKRSANEPEAVGWPKSFREKSIGFWQLLRLPFTHVLRTLSYDEIIRRDLRADDGDILSRRTK